MEIKSKYNPAETEEKWYKYWLDNKLFESTPDEREPYTIVIPPPNVTGVLHMGHMLNNTIQDVLIRRARMQGKNALWIPGTDHASIATEAKVVAKLKKEGVNKTDLTRNGFLEQAWEWTHKHGGIILEQLKKLGASCDWSRTRFTMEKELYESVVKVFVDLYEKDQIYRGVRMVNWDPEAQTAVSDEEVIYKEEQSKLYYVKYQIVGSDDYLTIATTRPETILGDTAVCVNPNDQRYQHLRDAKVIIPLVNRQVPIIFDEYVDMEFGTGALKITPAHDINDYEIGQRFNLEIIDIFNDNGTLNQQAELYIGQDRFEVRDVITEDLKKEGYLLKIEDYVNKVGRSERTDAVIEPKLSMQWFLKMKELAKPALENVLNDTIQLHPAKFKNVYRHWMENVRDWCISRQLWWGQRIPVYYINGEQNNYVVAQTIEKALELAKEKTGDAALTLDNLKQDEDVLDTWFSSWLWPISVFNGINNPHSKDLNYYYPTNVLVTGPDILFFWVARMIISGYEYKNNYPFKDVYLTGMVRDKQRRKMSKSLGNSPDPIMLMEKYGADGVRVGMLLCAPAGGDLLFDESLPEQGRNFSNKIWNAFRLVKSWNAKDIEQNEADIKAIEWFDAKLNETIKTIDFQFETYRLSEALMTVYRLFWDEFSSWYLEMVKPTYGKPIAQKTLTATIELFDKLLRILHPFIPFITEEVWQLLTKRKEGESIVCAPMPPLQQYDQAITSLFEDIKEGIKNIRTIRTDKNIPFKESLQLCVKAKSYNNYFDAVLQKMCNLSEILQIEEKEEGSVAFMVKTTEYFIPLGDMVDKEEELKKLTSDLEYNKGFLQKVMKKLGNERFVNNAPQKVVDIERKKQADAQTKINALEKQIADLQ